VPTRPTCSPPYLVPSDWQASVSTGLPFTWSRRRSCGTPCRSTPMTTSAVSLIVSVSRPGSDVRVSRRTSVNSSRTPMCRAPVTVPANVRAGTATRVSRPQPSACNAACSADVQLLNATAYGAPVRSAMRFSTSPVHGPSVQVREYATSVSSFTSSSVGLAGQRRWVSCMAQRLPYGFRTRVPPNDVRPPRGDRPRAQFIPGRGQCSSRIRWRIIPEQSRFRTARMGMPGPPAHSGRGRPADAAPGLHAVGHARTRHHFFAVSAR
jgi:hypothetical protein